MLLKRSALVIFTGYVLFIVFSYIGEYETMILPLFADKPAASTTPPGEKAAIEKTLETYGKGLAVAYDARDPNKLNDQPIAEGHKQEIITDILFQVMKGRTLQLTLRKMEIKNLNFMGPAVASVEVHEVWEYSYKYDKGAKGPDGGISTLDGVYTMQKTMKGWEIVSFSINDGFRRNIAG